MGEEFAGLSLFVQIIVQYEGRRSCQFCLAGELCLDTLYFLLERSIGNDTLAKGVLSLHQLLVSLGQVRGFLGLCQNLFECILHAGLCDGQLIVHIGLLYVGGYQGQSLCAVAVIGEFPVIGIEHVIILMVLACESYHHCAVAHICIYMVVRVSALFYP